MFYGLFDRVVFAVVYNYFRVFFRGLLKFCNFIKYFVYVLEKCIFKKYIIYEKFSIFLGIVFFF